MHSSRTPVSPSSRSGPALLRWEEPISLSLSSRVPSRLRSSLTGHGDAQEGQQQERAHDRGSWNPHSCSLLLFISRLTQDSPGKGWGGEGLAKCGLGLRLSLNTLKAAGVGKGGGWRVGE